MSLPYARVQIAEEAKAPRRAQPSSTPDAPAVVALRGKDLKESASTFAVTVRLLKEQGVIESYAQCVLLAHSIKGRAVQPYIRELQQQDIPLSGFSS